MANGPYTLYTDADEIYDELPHTLVTYGDPYSKAVGSAFVPFRVKTTTIAYRYRLCFLTQSAAEAGIAALQAEFDATGAALTPARNIAAVSGQLAYDGLAYDIIVNYCDSSSEEEEI